MTPEPLKGKLGYIHALKSLYGDNRVVFENQLKSAVEGLIKFHEDRIDNMIKNLENNVIVVGLEMIIHEYESIMAIEHWLEDVI
jgi:hypothetical protein